MDDEEGGGGADSPPSRPTPNPVFLLLLHTQFCGEINGFERERLVHRLCSVRQRCKRVFFGGASRTEESIELKQRYLTLLGTRCTYHFPRKTQTRKI